MCNKRSTNCPQPSALRTWLGSTRTGTPDRTSLARLMTPSEQARAVRSILLLDPEDLYRTLGIDSCAGSAAVQQSYLRRARATHPDKNQAEGADEAFKRVAHARSILCDAARRAAYDAERPGIAVSVAQRRRPCERRAGRRRKAQESAQQSFTEGSQFAEDSECHAADSDSDFSVADPWESGAGCGGGGSSAAPGREGFWGSWQPRSEHPAAAATGAGPRSGSGKVQKKARRRASGRADSATAAAAAAATRTVGSAGARGGGQGRGSLGKRPWRRAARVAAKKEAKQGKTRTKARRHLQQ